MTLVTIFRQEKVYAKATHYHQMVFNIVADMLAILIERAKSDGQIEG
jgi:hypothetical protein